MGLVSAEEKTTVYLFHGEECPHCAKERSFLDKLEKKYPSLEVKLYEVWHNKENADLFVRLSKGYGIEVGGVPATFIGEEIIIGFDSEEGKGRLIEEKIVKCIEDGCIDPITKLDSNGAGLVTEGQNIVDLPFFGKIDATTISLPLLTMALGLVDGFNACAMFVLLVLIGILLRTKSRRKMAIISGIFIFTSGLVYFLFMSVWLNALSLLGNIGFVFTIAGLIAVIVGLINVKDFFFFKKGPSLSIPESAKKGIFEKMRRIINAESFYIMIGAVIILAVSVNFVEFLCTFGLPMVFTSILANSEISTFMKYFYLVLYQVFYMFDDMIVVVIAVVTLSSKRMTEDYGRVLKLVAGTLMLVLGLILLFKPEWLMFG